MNLQVGTTVENSALRSWGEGGAGRGRDWPSGFKSVSKSFSQRDRRVT